MGQHLVIHKLITLGQHHAIVQGQHLAKEAGVVDRELLVLGGLLMKLLLHLDAEAGSTGALVEPCPLKVAGGATLFTDQALGQC